jgi:phosphocarrier protein FPr
VAEARVVGLVIVSHSAALAEGVLELVREVAGPEVKVAAAGGLALPGRPLGTDPVLVADAIRQADGGDGVAVLMDLGSAVLSAEMALDLLAPDLRGRVALCAAPLVEGAVAAAVQARLGEGLERVLAEARGALGAKVAHLESGPGAGESAPAGPASAGTAEPAGEEVQVLEWVIANRLGLHARPAAKLVRAAAAFPGARIQVRNLTAGRGPAPAASINALAMLGLSKGHTMAL